MEKEYSLRILRIVDELEPLLQTRVFLHLLPKILSRFLVPGLEQVAEPVQATEPVLEPVLDPAVELVAEPEPEPVVPQPHPPGPVGPLSDSGSAGGWSHLSAELRRRIPEPVVPIPEPPAKRKRPPKKPYNCPSRGLLRTAEAASIAPKESLMVVQAGKYLFGHLYPHGTEASFHDVFKDLSRFFKLSRPLRPTTILSMLRSLTDENGGPGFLTRVKSSRRDLAGRYLYLYKISPQGAELAEQARRRGRLLDICDPRKVSPRNPSWQPEQAEARLAAEAETIRTH